MFDSYGSRKKWPGKKWTMEKKAEGKNGFFPSPLTFFCVKYSAEQIKGGPKGGAPRMIDTRSFEEGVFPAKSEIQRVF